MHFTTPQAMEAHLGTMLDDLTLIRRAVREKFPTWKGGKPKKPVQPVVSRQGKDKTGPAESALKDVRDFEKMMREGSEALLKAISIGRGPKGFIWRKSVTSEPIDTNRRAVQIGMMRAAASAAYKAELDAAPRTSRDPCFKCGTRGDAGCQHRAAA